MSSALPSPPAGYREVRVGDASLVALDELIEDFTALLRSHGTLYDAAFARPNARPLTGRGTAYAIALPKSDTRVVVRHNRHGGLLARLTGDRFVHPTRAPLELATAIRLHHATVRTVTVAAYAIYPSGPFARSDVATVEVPDARDLGDILVDGSEEERYDARRATSQLLVALSRAGAVHEDLNVKNVLVQRLAPIDSAVAYALDVDRVVFHTPDSGSVAVRNYDRLVRSARKWRTTRGATITEDELAMIWRTAFPT